MRISDWSSDVCSSDLIRNTSANTTSVIAKYIEFPLRQSLLPTIASLLREWPRCATEKNMTVPDTAPRSLLYVPASNARALEKARGLAADMLIIDLEDAVPEARQAEAPAGLPAALAGRYPGQPVEPATSRG